MRRNLGILVVLVISVFSNISLASDAVLNIAVPADPDTFDPHRTVAAASAEIAFNVYEGLVKATPQGGVEGALATHWEVDETKTVYTFYLRDAKFHDGTPVRVSDAAAALNKARDPNVSQRAAEFSDIDSITPLEGAIRIKLKEPNAAFVYSLSEPAAAIYPENASNLAIQPVGTGPYRLVEWRPNQYVKLERFDHHWSGKKPYYKEVFFRIIPDENSMVLNLKSGRVDLIPRLEASVLHQVEHDSSLKVLSGPMNVVQVLAINNARPPFDDWRVRKALALAVNKEEVILGAAWGYGKPLDSGISPAMAVFYNDELSDVNPYDPKQAQTLLREAGLEDLSFTLVLPAAYPLHIQTGELVAEQWKQIGLDVNIQIVEWGTWLEKVYSQRDYDVSIIGLAGRLDPHPILVRYESSNSRNFFNFSNERYDELIRLGLLAEEEERVQIYHEAQRILAEEVAGVFIMDPPHLAAMSKTLKGWQHYPTYVVDVASLYQ